MRSEVDGRGPKVSGKKIVIGLVGAVLMLAALTSVYVRANGTSLRSAYDAAGEREPALRHTDFTVEELTSAASAAALEDALRKTPGVTQVSSRFEHKSVSVVYDSKRVSTEQIVEAVKPLGFTAIARSVAQ